MDKKISLYLYNRLKNKTKFENFIKFIANISTNLIAINYIIFLLYTLITKNLNITKCILIPIFIFVVITILRKLINRKRPFEILNIKPIINHKNGNSMPSRHTSSAFSIALIIFFNNQIWGIICIIIALLVAITRVLTYVHYISDVLIAFLISFIMSFIFFI